MHFHSSFLRASVGKRSSFRKANRDESSGLDVSLDTDGSKTRFWAN